MPEWIQLAKEFGIPVAFLAVCLYGFIGYFWPYFKQTNDQQREFLETQIKHSQDQFEKMGCQFTLSLKEQTNDFKKIAEDIVDAIHSDKKSRKK